MSDLLPRRRGFGLDLTECASPGIKGRAELRVECVVVGAHHSARIVEGQPVSGCAVGCVVIPVGFMFGEGSAVCECQGGSHGDLGCINVCRRTRSSLTIKQAKKKKEAVAQDASQKLFMAYNEGLRREVFIMWTPPTDEFKKRNFVNALLGI